MDGKISRIRKDKGFGFITGRDGIERFFHASEVKGATFDQLTEGQAVRFEHDDGPKGPRANAVTLT